MIDYKLWSAVAVVAASICSGLVYLLAQRKHGYIRLDEEPENPIGFDPFEVATSRDGDPLNEETFWAHMRTRRLVVITCAVTATALQITITARTFILHTKQDCAVSALYVVASLYMVLMSSIPSFQNDFSNHRACTIHLVVVSLWTAFVSCTTALLPTVPHSPSAFDTTSAIISLAAAGLYCAIFIVTVTTPLGPFLHFLASHIYDDKTISQSTRSVDHNVSGIVGASVWGFMLCSHTTSVVSLGKTSSSIEVGDLPILPASMRASNIYASTKAVMRNVHLRFRRWRPQSGSGWTLGWRLIVLNRKIMLTQFALAVACAGLFYVPALFLNKLLQFLQERPSGDAGRWGWVYCVGLFGTTAVMHLLADQLWFLSTTTFEVRAKIQLNSLLYAKTLLRRDVASSSTITEDIDAEGGSVFGGGEEDDEDDGDTTEFSTKSQVMNLMTTDVDHVSEFSWHLFSLIDAPLELVIGSVFLWSLLGISSLVGLGAVCLFMPLNHIAGKVVMRAQDGLMETRDRRVALMNEILGAIRMLKFMAWERNFEKKAHEVRSREIRFQRLNYLMESAFEALWDASPLIVNLVSFWHFTVWRGQKLTPDIAFTSISVFHEMSFALTALPETFISILQSMVSLRRIEKYLESPEVTRAEPLDRSYKSIFINSATISWPQHLTPSSSVNASPISTPARSFMLNNLSLKFPSGEFSLICGRLGSGKTLLLLALLGEADVLVGQVTCPRSPPDVLASFAGSSPTDEDWIVPGVVAYVPQTAWLRNASIKDNILFSLPYNEARYRRTLEVCALWSDLEILEDGDFSEIGERGVNISGGQKARVSLARAIYSRASVLLLDDILSAVDAHTAQHLYKECLRGDLAHGRTIILVSHHVALCAPGAAYVVALDMGQVFFSGSGAQFAESGNMEGLGQHKISDREHAGSGSFLEKRSDSGSDATATVAREYVKRSASDSMPRKVVEEEKRVVGRIGRDVWSYYFSAVGGRKYWFLFAIAHLIGALAPVVDATWLRHWSKDAYQDRQSHNPSYFLSVYAIITVIGIMMKTCRPLVLYHGSLHASRILYERLLESILFAPIRFHDTVSRGRLLNRFGQDMEQVDSSLANGLGQTIVSSLSVITAFMTITYIGGWQFLLAAGLILAVYYDTARVYGQISRDMRRLDSVTKSPLYSLYGETIAGVHVIRAFGASSKFLRDMLRHVDTNINPYYWMWSIHTWLAVRTNLFSAVIIGVTAVVVVLMPSIDAALAGVALTFAMSETSEILWAIRRFVSLEQSMVAVERIKEYSELAREPPEFVKPGPPTNWPAEGSIEVKSLSVRYAPDLPEILHQLSFSVKAGEKVGILGRTGSGKSTLALALFRFVEATEGAISIDGLDIARMGLTDLRGKLTIIPQEPSILSGTIRSNLDVFGEYNDAEMFEALHRVHLIPPADSCQEESETENPNIFRNLDSSVSENGDNMSNGEKQLLCMARAILKRSMVLVMDEATANVDYGTDELISRTIREEFASSTILTIAHRLRSVITYDRVMVLEQGFLKEYDRPSILIQDETSAFYQLCKATGKDEFNHLMGMAGVVAVS